MDAHLLGPSAQVPAVVTVDHGSKEKGAAVKINVTAGDAARAVNADMVMLVSGADAAKVSVVGQDVVSVG